MASTDLKMGKKSNSGKRKHIPITIPKKLEKIWILKSGKR
jgi:hypothetical protein